MVKHESELIFDNKSEEAAENSDNMTEQAHLPPLQGVYKWAWPTSQSNTCVLDNTDDSSDEGCQYRDLFGWVV